jgi:hypothetical protein
MACREILQPGVSAPLMQQRLPARIRETKPLTSCFFQDLLGFTGSPIFPSGSVFSSASPETRNRIEQICITTKGRDAPNQSKELPILRVFQDL